MPGQNPWQFSIGGDSPAFQFWICRFDPTSKTLIATYLCQSLINLECNLSVGGTVGEMAATFGDQDNAFFASVADQPRAMDGVQLQLRNRHGQWAPAWTGLVDSVSRSVQPGQGNTVIINATSPIKKFEITAQRPGDVAGIALASISGLKGSAILAYACKPNECNYPGELSQVPAAVGQTYSLGTVVDLNADSGAQNWSSISSSVFTNPTQQLWSAVIAAVQADSGIEWFADEMGRILWRRPGFLNVGPQTPRRILEEDILHHTISEGDAGVVTRIEVRYGNVPLVNNATTTGTTSGKTPGPGVWVAPDEMTNQLGYRNRVIYAPWIRSAAAAQSLATFLGEIFSANTQTATVTIPADPYFNVGSVIEVPTLRAAPDQKGAPETAYFYISSVLYQLDWGTSWTMTLGLTYGRSKTDGFPYLKNFKWPVLSAKQKQEGLPTGTLIQGTIGTGDPSNPLTGKIPNLFTFGTTSDLVVGSNTAITDPNVIPWGTEFYVLNSGGSTLLDVVAQQANAKNGPTVSGYNVLLPTPSLLTSGYVTLIASANYNAATSTGTGGGGNSQPGAQPTATQPTPTSASANYGPQHRFEQFPVVGYTMRTISVGQEYGQTNLSGTLPGNWLEYPYTEPDGTYHPNFHVGIDISPPGGGSAPICAAVGGTVIGVGYNNTYPVAFDASARKGLGDGSTSNTTVPIWDGNDVAILTNNNLITNYGHLAEGSVKVTVGQTVTAGQPIGTMGATGYAYGIHLHFSIFDLTYRGWRNPRDYLPTGAST